MKTRKNLSVCSLLQFAIISALCTGVAHAASTWTGGAAPNTFFSAGANWDTAPNIGAANTLNFDGSGNVVSNDLAFSASYDQTINFNATAGGFYLMGSSIRVGGVVNNSASLQNIYAGLRINGGRTFNAGTAGLYLGTPVGSTGTSGRTVTKTGTGDLTIGSGTATSGGAGYSVSAGALVFSGSVATSLGSAANGVSLTATGTTLKLNNSGTLSMGGAITTVLGSSIILNNTGAATITGGTTVAAGASLTGNGSLLGGLVSVAGNLAPGNSGIGTISVASLTLAAGSTTTLEIDRAAGQNADLISATGTVGFGGNLVVNNIGGNLMAGDSFNLFDGTLGGTFDTTTLPTLTPDLQWDTSQLGTTGILTVLSAPVPEPSSLALLGLGGLLGIRQLRRGNS